VPIQNLQHSQTGIHYGALQSVFTDGAYGKFYGCASQYHAPTSVEAAGTVSPSYLVYCAGSSAELNYKPLRCIVQDTDDGSGSTATTEMQINCAVADVDIHQFVPNSNQPVTQPPVFTGFRGAALLPMPPGVFLTNPNVEGESDSKAVKGVIVMFPASGATLAGMVVFQDFGNVDYASKLTMDANNEVLMTMQLPINSVWATRSRLFDRVLAVPDATGMVQISAQCRILGLGTLSFLQFTTWPVWHNQDHRCAMGYNGGAPTISGHSGEIPLHYDDNGVQYPCTVITLETRTCQDDNPHSCCQGVVRVPYIYTDDATGVNHTFYIGATWSVNNGPEENLDTSAPEMELTPIVDHEMMMVLEIRNLKYNF